MEASPTRASKNSRARPRKRVLTRFQVLGRDADRDLIRLIARQLAEGGPEADRLRAAVSEIVAGTPSKPSGILAALRSSPLVGADLDLTRQR
jgi:hypothetical protein